MAVLLATIGLYDLYFSIVSTNWPTASGEITESRVTPPSSHRNWELHVKYEFMVSGIEHQGDVYRFGGGSFFSQRAAETVAAQYIPDDPVKVFYDPDNPDRAVLVPGIDSDNWWDFAYCIGGLIGFVYCVKKLLVKSNRSDTSFENAKNTSLPV